MRRALLAIVLLASVGAADAHAQLTIFRTPSGNIQCGYFSESPRWLRCDMSATDNRPPPKPESCEFEWGYSFVLTPRGRGRRLCVSDAVGVRPGFVLRYGRTFKRGGYRCVSRRAYLRCTNSRRRGFQLSRSAQKLF